MEGGIPNHNLDPIHLRDALQHGLSLASKRGEHLPFQLGAPPGDGGSSNLTLSQRQLVRDQDDPRTLSVVGRQSF